jgi:hypothetical protein
VALADVGAGDVHFGAHGLEVQHFFGGHLVGHHQHHPIAFGPADQRQAQAGVAGGGFDDGAGRRRPSRSAASIMARPMRSLIEPPGFCDSSLRNSVQGPVSKRLTRTSGVLPISSSTAGRQGWACRHLDPGGMDS